MNFHDYQLAASETNQYRRSGPQAAIPPMLGLASETGQVLNVYKNYLRDGVDLKANREFLKQELGDLLWYLTAVATTVGLDMEEIAEVNLQRTHDRYQSENALATFRRIKPLDDGYPEHERFPRRLVVEFIEDKLPSGQLAASLAIVSAEPNVFSNGPKSIGGKEFGFTVGSRLGAQLTDNSRRNDAYRYHDAIHMGFMAVLGWSPTIRALLRLKRKSNADIDESEDGARAIFAEEGLAAVLSRLAENRSSFQTEVSVDGDALVVVKAATMGLEVERLPTWLWRKAISQGFLAMQNLDTNSGGYLIADLNLRELTYQKVLS